MCISKKCTTFAAVFAQYESNMQAVDVHKIELSQYEIGHYQFDFQLNDDFFGALEKSEIVGGDVACVARLNLREDDFDLSIEVQGNVTLICDRCLDKMELSVSLDEVVEVDEQSKSLDLDWLAYELIVVNLPLVHCHPVGDCNPDMDALLQNHLCSTNEDPEAY